MTSEIIVLSFSAAAIAFVHTILGPDHYLPFVAMAKARGWSKRKTLKVTLICGGGHVAGSVALGVLGIVLGIQLSSLEWMESVRGNFAAWLLIGFGLAYTAATIACSGLLAFYVSYVLGSLFRGTAFGISISALYGVLYIIIQAEDYAFSMGAVLVFTALAAVMYFTRNFDWYKLSNRWPGMADGE